MLTRVFINVPDSLKEKFDCEYGKYSKQIGKMPDRRLANNNGFETRVIYPGTVYSLRIGELWEHRYSDLSFGAFKQLLFSTSFMEGIDGSHIVPRLQVNITYHKDYKDIQNSLSELLDAVVNVLKVHRNAERKSFEENTFISELSEQLGENRLDRFQIRMLLDLLTIEVKNNTDSKQSTSPYKVLLKRTQQRKPEAKEYIATGSSTLLKINFLKLLSQCRPDNNSMYRSYEPYTTGKAISIMPILKLMEIVGLASYDLRGGEKTEIFVRVNDPEKIKRLAYTNYQNGIVKEIVRKHKQSQELMSRFFSSKMTDEQRWDFIESYFLGMDFC